MNGTIGTEDTREKEEIKIDQKMMEWSQIIMLTLSVLFLSVTLLLTGWIFKLHWTNSGQEPEWKSRVLPLLLLFSLHSVNAFVQRFMTIYTESFLFLYNAYTLHQLYHLFLFFFNKQSSLYFQHDAYAKIEIKKSSQSEYLPDTIRAKTNYCFLRCVGFLLQPQSQPQQYHEQSKVDESHFLLVYGTRFLQVSEGLLVGQIFLALFSLMLSLSVGHMEFYATHFYLIVLCNLFVSLLCFVCITTFLIVTERVIHPFNPRFKLALIVLPICTTALLPRFLPESLAIFVIQMEQLFLLVSTMWVFSPTEHNHILSVNTIAEI